MKLFKGVATCYMSFKNFNRVFLNAAVNIEKHQEFHTKLEGLFIEIIREFYQINVEISLTKSKQVFGFETARGNRYKVRKIA